MKSVLLLVLIFSVDIAIAAMPSTVKIGDETISLQNTVPMQELFEVNFVAYSGTWKEVDPPQRLMGRKVLLGYLISHLPSSEYEVTIKVSILSFARASRNMGGVTSKADPYAKCLSGEGSVTVKNPVPNKRTTWKMNLGGCSPGVPTLYQYEVTYAPMKSEEKK